MQFSRGGQRTDKKKKKSHLNGIEGGTQAIFKGIYQNIIETLGWALLTWPSKQPPRNSWQPPNNARANNPNNLVSQVHSMHQSLRDLRSDQLRMGDDIDREISRRNRSL